MSEDERPIVRDHTSRRGNLEFVGSGMRRPIQPTVRSSEPSRAARVASVSQDNPIAYSAPAAVPAAPREPAAAPENLRGVPRSSVEPDVSLSDPIRPEVAKPKTYQPAQRKSKKGLVVGIILSLVVVAGGLTGAFFYLQSRTPKSPFSDSIRKQADFSLFFPMNDPNYTVDASTIRYETSNAMVYYDIRLAGNAGKVIASMQNGKALTGDDAKYQTFIEGLHPQSSFKNNFGDVHVTKPDGLNDDLVAVLLYHNTVLFLRAPGTFKTADWQQLLSNLYVTEGIKKA